MRVLSDPIGAVKSLIGANSSPSQAPVYFNTGKSAADARAEQLDAAEQAKRTSLAETAKKQGAASTLITSPDLGSDFAGLNTRKTLLGGA